jgi:hypothetical protein
VPGVGLLDQLVTEAGHDAKLGGKPVLGEMWQGLESPGQRVEPDDLLVLESGSLGRWLAAQGAEEGVVCVAGVAESDGLAIAP